MYTRLGGPHYNVYLSASTTIIEGGNVGEQMEGLTKSFPTWYSQWFMIENRFLALSFIAHITFTCVYHDPVYVITLYCNTGICALA